MTDGSLANSVSRNSQNHCVCCPAIKLQLPLSSMPYKIVTLIYAVRDDQVLLLKRRKPPYAGHWVAPGGKVERGESPRECAIRELREETGLCARDAELRALITETSPRDDWQWLIFVYRAVGVEGDVVTDEREGELRWFPVESTFVEPSIPPADQVFMHDALREPSGTTEYRFTYDEDLHIIDRAH